VSCNFGLISNLWLQITLFCYRAFDIRPNCTPLSLITIINRSMSTKVKVNSKQQCSITFFLFISYLQVIWLQDTCKSLALISFSKVYKYHSQLLGYDIKYTVCLYQTHCFSFCGVFGGNCTSSEIIYRWLVCLLACLLVCLSSRDIPILDHHLFPPMNHWVK